MHLFNFFLHVCDVCSNVWCLPTCMISSYLCDVCLLVWILSASMRSALLYDVCLPVWFLPTYMMMSAQFRHINFPYFFVKLFFCAVKLAKFGKTTVYLALFLFCNKKNFGWKWNFFPFPSHFFSRNDTVRNFACFLFRKSCEIFRKTVRFASFRYFAKKMLCEMWEFCYW
jgi:hypothetical protein